MKPLSDPIVTGIIDALASVKLSQAEIFTQMATHLPGLSNDERAGLEQSASASFGESEDLKRLLPSP